MVDVGGVNPEAVADGSAGIFEHIDCADGCGETVAAADVLDTEPATISLSFLQRAAKDSLTTREALTRQQEYPHLPLPPSRAFPSTHRRPCRRIFS